MDDWAGAKVVLPHLWIRHRRPGMACGVQGSNQFAEASCLGSLNTQIEPPWFR